MLGRLSLLGVVSMLSLARGVRVLGGFGATARPAVCRSARHLVRMADVEAAPVETVTDAKSALVNSEFLKEMQWRGFIAQATDVEGLDKALSTRSVTAYLGFDATATSLHVGSLLQIMLLRHFQRCGHKPVVLVGGGTTKVGDPSGKDASRQLLTQEKIDENIAGISSVFQKFLVFGDGESDARMINNDEWLSSLQYLDFLREYGRHFTINRMLSFESVKQRLARESPLSFLEFNYMILQAYDFLELNRRLNAELQFGGSDQWGNIINGVELARRADGASLFGMTSPLLTTADGKKMGKTADGAVWLNPELLSPFEYWQFWRNTADADVGRFLRIFTELPRARIEELEALPGAQINEAKVVLADEATSMLHGAECLTQIKETAASLFAGGGKGGGAGGGATDSLPRVQLSAAEAGEGVPVLELFLRLEMAKSKGEVRRLVSGGGARLNGEKLDDAELVVSATTFADASELKLSAGKKKHGIVELV